MVDGKTGLSHALDRIERSINLLARLVMMASMLTLFIVLLLSILLRFLGRGQDWSVLMSELPTLLLPWLIFGGVVAAAQYGAHLSITFLTGRLRGGPQRAAVTLRLLAIFWVYGVLAWNTLDVLPIVADEHSAILGVSNGVTYGCVVGGFVLLLITEAVHYLRYLLWAVPLPSSFTGEPPGPGDDGAADQARPGFQAEPEQDQLRNQSQSRVAAAAVRPACSARGAS